MLLSILIATTPDRQEQFDSLKAELDRQIKWFSEFHWEFIRDYGGIELIVDSSKKYLDGGLSIGGKRQKLLKMATGKYVCYADSDDGIAPNYIETLARMCIHDADAISFRCLFKNDTYWTVIDMSLEHEENEDASPHKIVKRKIWQVCPIKREIAVQHSFSELNHGEDVEWLNRVLPDIKTEVHTDQILTQYNHSAKTSEADKILKAGFK
jgi:glycosyltransferase involved in cell wall biosynthesis